MKQQNKQIPEEILFMGRRIFAITGYFEVYPLERKREDENETVKMLDQDGRLVEIDKQLLASSVKKIITRNSKIGSKNKSLITKTT